MAKLFGTTRNNITIHLKDIYDNKELDENSVVRKSRTVASNGKSYNINYYNLDMIVAIGFRVRSNMGTNFRKWAKINGIYD